MNTSQQQDDMKDDMKASDNFLPDPTFVMSIVVSVSYFIRC